MLGVLVTETPKSRLEPLPPRHASIGAVLPTKDGPFFTPLADPEHRPFESGRKLLPFQSRSCRASQARTP